jgi:hypothetical protein
VDTVVAIAGVDQRATPGTHHVIAIGPRQDLELNSCIRSKKARTTGDTPMLAVVVLAGLPVASGTSKSAVAGGDGIAASGGDGAVGVANGWYQGVQDAGLITMHTPQLDACHPAQTI